MNVLGLNAYHGDVSAALVRDGKLIAAVEEERFRRIKHITGFPHRAIGACLEMGGITATNVDIFAVSRQPRAHLWRETAKISTFVAVIPPISRHAPIARCGKPVMCLIRRNRSSSTAAISLPSRTSAADTSP